MYFKQSNRFAFLTANKTNKKPPALLQIAFRKKGYNGAMQINFLLILLLTTPTRLTY